MPEKGKNEQEMELKKVGGDLRQKTKSLKTKTARKRHRDRTSSQSSEGWEAGQESFWV